MKLWVNPLNVRKRNWLVQQLLVERKREAGVEAMTVEHRDAQNPPDEVKV